MMSKIWYICKNEVIDEILCLNLDKSIKFTLAIYKAHRITIFLDNAIKLVLVFAYDYEQ